MKWWSAALAALVLALGAAPAAAQSRADTAAVLLHTAEQLRQRGEPAAARTLLDYLQRQYAGTPAAEQAQRLQVAMRRVQQERPGRVELLVGGTTYGAWLGIAVPLMLDADGPEAYGLGFLAGAPVGFLAARAYNQRHQPTEGQARAITFGGTWGTYQGFGWGQVLGIGDRQNEWVCVPEEGLVCTSEPDAHGPTRVGVAVATGLAGIGTGVYLARRPITAGTAAAVSTSALWSSWFGVAFGVLAGLEDDDLLAAALAAGNVGLVGGALMAPRWQVSEPRVRLISVGGLIGGLAGVGVLLITQPDDEKVAISIPLATSAIGLGVGIHTTRDRDAAQMPGGGDGSQGALLNLDGRRWALDMPAPELRLQRGQRNEREAAAYVPLLRARF